MWIVVNTSCFPNEWKVAWNGTGGGNWYFFKSYGMAQDFADLLNGGK